VTGLQREPSVVTTSGAAAGGRPVTALGFVLLLSCQVRRQLDCCRPVPDL